eukprot:TRINITY_DN13462_c0_g1_i1.p1 TRINITY_DN13462_c0_g1~~TRINITY_DN13462_c0_g1_i1.p1  ORF type:complete len:261 (-),score=6.32 TRINITY_DN13462_c0_g1_i1:56-838(-)
MSSTSPVRTGPAVADYSVPPVQPVYVGSGTPPVVREMNYQPPSVPLVSPGLHHHHHSTHRHHRTSRSPSGERLFTGCPSDQHAYDDFYSTGHPTGSVAPTYATPYRGLGEGDYGHSLRSRQRAEPPAYSLSAPAAPVPAVAPAGWPSGGYPPAPPGGYPLAPPGGYPPGGYVPWEAQGAFGPAAVSPMCLTIGIMFIMGWVVGGVVGWAVALGVRSTASSWEVVWVVGWVVGWPVGWIVGFIFSFVTGRLRSPGQYGSYG